MAALAGAALSASALASPAMAFFSSHGAGPSICSAQAHRLDVPGLWLGHFGGGRWAAHPNGDRRVDWRSEYRCFHSARACHAWRADMRRAYGRFSGHGACIALRAGGTPTQLARRAPARR